MLGEGYHPTTFQCSPKQDSKKFDSQEEPTLARTRTNLCFLGVDVDVSKNRGKTPKMDGENNGKPY